jgi:hypothetical protein
VTDGADVTKKTSESRGELRSAEKPAPLPRHLAKLCEAIAAFRQADGAADDDDPTSLGRTTLEAVLMLSTRPNGADRAGLEKLRNLALTSVGKALDLDLTVNRQQTQEAKRLVAHMEERLSSALAKKVIWKGETIDELAKSFLADVFGRNDLPLSRQGPIACDLRRSGPFVEFLEASTMDLAERAFPLMFAVARHGRSTSSASAQDAGYGSLVDPVASAFTKILTAPSADDLEAADLARRIVKAGCKSLGYEGEPLTGVKKARERTAKRRSRANACDN